MKVYLQQHPHGMYRDLIKYPPVEYLVIGEKTIDKIIRLISYPRVAAIYYRNVPKNVLIHTHQTLIKNRQPWVCDHSHAILFIHSRDYWKIRDERYRKSAEKYLNSRYCKKIMATSYAANNTIKDFYRVEDKSKLEVVYPAIHKERIERKKNEIKNIFFVSSPGIDKFYRKGGKYVLNAFYRLREKYPQLKLNFLGQVPQNYRRKFDENINYLGPIYNEKKIFDFYKEQDLLWFPTLMDIFGYVLLEAMSCEVPIITTDGFARNEIITHGETGFLIKLPANFKRRVDRFEFRNYNEFVEYVKNINFEFIVEDLIKYTERLIENTKEYRRIQKKQRREIISGKFSIKERNKKLKRIYEEAIKG